MKLRAVFWFFALAVLGLADARAAGQQLWTCGMHPQIIKTEPGNCPICGMKLTPILGTATVPKGAEAAQIHLDSAVIQRMNLKTGLVTRGPVRREIRAVGSVAYDEQGLRDVTMKYEGWIEKLFVNATWTKVKAGDPLFEVYSPDLYNAELNYLVARHSEPDADGVLTRAALGRLQLFDISPEFIAELARTGEARRTFVFRAPSDGVVIEKMAVVGQMMKPGERVYRLADLSSVWVLAQIYEQDLPFVHPGQTANVHVTYGSDQTFAGRIELLLPEVQEQTRSAIARIVLPNSNAVLRPGMFVDVRLEAQLADSAVLVPEMAVLRSGERDTVFLAREGGQFEPREVKLGARAAGGDYEVLSGLKAGDRVVTSGQFMLDSESQLREAIQTMVPASASEATTPAGTALVGPAKPMSDSAAVGALTELAKATADAAAALARDDLAGYEKQRPVVNNALSAYFFAAPSTAHEALGSFEDGLAKPADLPSARHDFETFSTAVVDLARSADIPHAAGLHVYECPMAPITGKARWLQREVGTRNPFYGSTMLTCGEELR